MASSPGEPISRLTRLFIFLLSSMALSIAPGAIRAMVRLRVEKNIDDTLITILQVIGSIASIAMTVTAFYGLYFALFKKYH